MSSRSTGLCAHCVGPATRQAPNPSPTRVRITLFSRCTRPATRLRLQPELVRDKADQKEAIFFEYNGLTDPVVRRESPVSRSYRDWLPAYRPTAWRSCLSWLIRPRSSSRRAHSSVRVLSPSARSSARISRFGPSAILVRGRRAVACWRRVIAATASSRRPTVMRRCSSATISRNARSSRSMLSVATILRSPLRPAFSAPQTRHPAGVREDRRSPGAPKDPTAGALP